MIISNNKSILITLAVLLFILFMPCNVHAEDGPLGSADQSPTMIIMYARNNESDDKEGIALYSYSEGEITIKDAKEGIIITNPIEGLTVSFKDGSFVITLSDDAEINLEAYFTNDEDSGKSYSMIYSPCDLKIVGNGTLTMTALSKPSALAESEINAFINVEGDVYIGDELTHPSINLLTDLKSNDESPYVELEGILGDCFYIQNSKVYIETKNFALVNVPLTEGSVENAHKTIGDMVVIDNSSVKAKYKKLNEHDTNQTLCGIIYIQPMHNGGGLDTYRVGNFIVTNNSELEYSCDAENLYSTEEGIYAINLYGESGILVEDSKLHFNSNSKLNFCNVLKMLIISNNPNTFCSGVMISQKQETNYPLIKTNALEIFDSKFKFSTKKGPVFDLKVEPIIEEETEIVTGKSSLTANKREYPRVICPDNVNTYIYISESDENIEGIMEIETGNVFPYITYSPARLSLLRNGPIRTSSSKYDWIHIETCGKTYPIKNVGTKEGYLDSDIEKDGKLFHVFDFNVYEDTDDKIKANEYFKITKESDNSDESKHIVLNTGIN